MYTFYYCKYCIIQLLNYIDREVYEIQNIQTQMWPVVHIQLATLLKASTYGCKLYKTFKYTHDPKVDIIYANTIDFLLMYINTTDFI